MDINGVPSPEPADANLAVAPGKRKRDSEDEGAVIVAQIEEQQDDDSKISTPPPPTNGILRDQTELVKTCFVALKRYVVLPLRLHIDERRPLLALYF